MSHPALESLTSSQPQSLVGEQYAGRSDAEMREIVRGWMADDALDDAKREKVELWLATLCPHALSTFSAEREDGEIRACLDCGEFFFVCNFF